MKCPKCNKELEGDYCQSCGIKIKPKKRIGPTSIISIIMLIVSIIGMTVTIALPFIFKYDQGIAFGAIFNFFFALGYIIYYGIMTIICAIDDLMVSRGELKFSKIKEVFKYIFVLVPAIVLFAIFCWYLFSGSFEYFLKKL